MEWEVSENCDRFECRLRFFEFRSIEIPWDSNSGYVWSAGGE